ncbi:MAG TPA: VCBS repeat-containing protein, partial [Pyrinomonadaceae bacterium]|nr:VCBS repeat-containing protein [Pyrinomonadaceae bacterium]
ATVNETTFRVWGAQTGLRAGSVAYDPSTRKATFTPAEPFAYGELVSAVITRGAATAAGQHLRGFVWEFSVKTLPSGAHFERTAEWEGFGYAVAPADFDGDGDIDLATVQPGGVNVWKNDGAGSFRKHGDYAAPNDNPYRRSTKAADLDNDGDVDLAVGAGGTVVVIKNTGDGTFGEPAFYPVQAGNGPSSVVVADFDADGDLDVASVSTRWVSVLGNDGTGAFVVQFSPFAYEVPEFNAVLAAADFDEDGDVDLASGASGAGMSRAAILRNNGAGLFRQEEPSYQIGNSHLDFMCADVDGDRDVDLIQVGAGGRYDGAVNGNDGLGIFGGPGSYGVWGVMGVTADFDGDGRQNLAVFDNDQSYGRPPTLWVMWPHRSHTLDRTPHAAAAADVDGDGDADMIGITDGAVRTVFVLKNGDGP